MLDHGRVIAAGAPAELKRQVGGHTITVRLDDPADTELATAILAAVAGRAPDRTTRQQLSVPATGEDDLYEITARLREQSIAIAELSLRLPSLDEVFLALTGTPATKAAVPPPRN